MRRVTVIFMSLILFALTFILIPSTGFAAPEIKIAHIDDAGFEILFYALKQGIITSPKVKVKFYPMAIPALIQAMSSKQYDIIGTAAIVVPKAVERGLKAKIVALSSGTKEDGFGIFVKSNSDIKSVNDLKGKKLGVPSLSAGNVIQMKIVLQKIFGLNAARLGGDLSFVEVPPLQSVALLDRGGIDASFGFLISFYKLARHPDFRLLVKTAEEYKKAFGKLAPVEAYIAFEDSIAKNPEAIKEVQRLFFESRKYFTANGDRLVKEVAVNKKQDYEYLKWWFESGGYYPLSLEEEWVEALDRFYQLAYEIGDLRARPDTRKLIWNGYWGENGK